MSFQEEYLARLTDEELSHLGAFTYRRLRAWHEVPNPSEQLTAFVLDLEGYLALIEKECQKRLDTLRQI